MKCLCCGKKITSGSGCNWHKSCIEGFFGSKELPHLDISEEVLKELALKNSQKGYTVPGVQKKLSLRLSKDKKERLTLVGCPSGYILKPDTEEYPMLPENEYMVMSMAREIGIKTVPFSLIDMGSGKLAYITKRIDRIKDKKLAMEDFCQLDLRQTSDKYKGSYERCAKVIEKYSYLKKADIAELYTRVVFSFLTGNSDMHLKNFSLISYDDEKYQLSSAYDMLSVAIVFDDDDELALTINGKSRNIHRGDFITFGENIGLGKTASQKILDKYLSYVPKLINMCENSFLSDDLKKKWASLINKRKEQLMAF